MPVGREAPLRPDASANALWNVGLCGQHHVDRERRWLGLLGHWHLVPIPHSSARPTLAAVSRARRTSCRLPGKFWPVAARPLHPRGSGAKGVHAAGVCRVLCLFSPRRAHPREFAAVGPRACYLTNGKFSFFQGTSLNPFRPSANSRTCPPWDPGSILSSTVLQMKRTGTSRMRT